jgi:hypothetical protein
MPHRVAVIMFVVASLLGVETVSAAPPPPPPPPPPVAPPGCYFVLYDLRCDAAVNGGTTPSGSPQPPKVCSAWIASFYYDMAGSPLNLTRTLADGTIETYYTRDCPTGREDAWWAPFSPVDVATRAYRDLKSKRLPAPQPAFAPPATAMIVNFETWFGVAPVDPVVVRAEVPNAWAEATATPIGVELNVNTVWPGTEAHVACKPWGSTQYAANGCVWSPAYPSIPKVTGFDDLTYHATVDIVWHVTWTSSTGQTGAFDDIRTTTPVNITVMEIQTIGAPNL